MKTTNSKTGKLKNGLLKSGAVIASFVLISLTVSAQGFWKQLLAESSLNKVAMVMAGDLRHEMPREMKEQTNIENTRFTNNYQAEADQTLELQNWMTDQSYFGNTQFEAAQENDQELNLENWMTDPQYFNSAEKDQELDLENWMLNNQYWNS